jgi:geranylgeranyl pyrophosphate synthase
MHRAGDVGASDGRLPKSQLRHEGALRADAGPLCKSMLTVDAHVENTYHIIWETLAHEQDLPFPGFCELLRRVLADRRPSLGSLPWLLLPIFTCEALGGSIRQAQQVAAALEMGRIAAGCVDEWQDQDTDDALWKTLGATRTVNLAASLTSLSFLALRNLTHLGVDTSLLARLRVEFDRSQLHMCSGQDADLAGNLTLEDYEQVAGAKSGVLFRLGCRAGAMVAGAHSDVVACYGDYGYNLGIVAQIWNDLEGLVGARGKGDSEQQRSLPILAAQAVEGMAPDPLPEVAQAGPLYALVRLQVYHQRAAEALDRCPATGRLTLFLDAYATQPLIEKVRPIVSQEGEDCGH